MNIYENPMYDDFTGFTFNGRHSSEFGLLRVSKSDRYGDTLVPTLSNETADIPGGNGKYYYGETRGERKFEINFAYDNLEEKDKRRIRRWLHPDDQLHELIFDEKPFVKYWVKCEKEVAVDELCFNEGGKRIYKGDGTIPFVSYFTYGFVVNKDLASYEDWENRDEWSEASGLLRFSGNNNNEETTYDENDFHFLTIKDSSGHKLGCSVYNPGDAESGFVMKWTKEAGSNILENNNPTSATDNGYIPTNDIELNSSKSYYISYYTNEGLKFKQLSVNNDIVTIDGTEETGYFEIDGTNPIVFISHKTGELYNVYEGGDAVTYIYGTTKVDFVEGSNIYCIDEYNVAHLINVINVESSLTTSVTIQFLEEPSTVPTKLYIPFSSNCQYNIKITDPQNNTLKELSILLPGGATTNPKYWSEAQKAYFYGGDIKIDTNKKTISFKNNNDNNDNWVGIMGVVNGGTLFKIPIDELESDKQDFNQISIEVDSDLASQLSNATIDYNYLYI